MQDFAKEIPPKLLRLDEEIGAGKLQQTRVACSTSMVYCTGMTCLLGSFLMATPLEDHHTMYSVELTCTCT